MMDLEIDVMPEDQVVPCCSAAAHSGGDRCTCWVIELVSPQQPIQEGPTNVRRRACGDCAYRHDSVERQRGEEPNPAGGMIFCHWDGPEVLRAVHPPSGHSIPFTPGEAYDPIVRGDRAWKGDDRPQDWCAVGAAMNGARR